MNSANPASMQRCWTTSVFEMGGLETLPPSKGGFFSRTVSQKVLTLPNLVSTLASPPMIRAIFRAMASPSSVPP